MASRFNVLVVSLNESASAGQNMARRLSSAWRTGQPATFIVAESGDLRASSSVAADAVILLASPDTSAAQAIPVMDIFEEAGLPVLALLNGAAQPGNCFEFAGAIIDDQSAPDGQLIAALKGLLHRQAEIKRLRAEITLNQRFHGGLTGQVTKMHEELQLAALVQREFLPREMPTMHGVEFAALWRPTNYVSGDIYDLIRLDEDHVGVFVADAVGHGVPAALMTMVICRSLLTKEITGNSYRIVPPAEVLARLNLEMIHRQGNTTRFATASYAVVDCRQRRIQLAGAGHPPPVRLSSTGASEVLETTGGLLGVFPDESYSQLEIELNADDRVFFYTDGFEQAFPHERSPHHDRRLPTNQYRNEFDQLGRAGSAAAMIEAISRRLDDQAGSLHQIDDLTLVCMHAGPVAAATTQTGFQPVAEPCDYAGAHVSEQAAA